MSANKGGSAFSPSKDATLPLRDAVQRALRNTSEWTVVTLHLSRLAPPAPRPHHRRIARAVFEDAASRHQGQLFTLATGDLVLLFTAADGGVATVRTLAELFAADAPDPALLLSRWSLPDHLSEFTAFLDALPTLVASPGKAEQDSGLAAVTTLFNAVEPRRIRDLLVRQTGVLITIGGTDRVLPVFREVRFSLPALEARAAASGRVTADPFLFRHLIAKLDGTMLTATTADLEYDRPLVSGVRSGPMALHVNMSLEAVFSPAFTALADAAARTSTHVAVEIALLEAFSDTAAFAKARTLIKDTGFTLVLDDVSHHALVLTKPGALGADWFKLDWSRQMLQAGVLIDDALKAADPDRAILQKADTEDAVRWGAHARDPSVPGSTYRRHARGRAAGDLPVGPELHPAPMHRARERRHTGGAHRVPEPSAPRHFASRCDAGGMMENVVGLEALSESVRNTMDAGVARHAMLLRTERLPSALSRAEQLKHARAALDPLTKADRARWHDLPSGRIVISWKGDQARLVTQAIDGLTSLLNNFPLNAPPLPDLFDLFTLPESGDALLKAAVTGLSVEAADVVTAPGRSHRQQAQLQALEPAELDRLEQSLAGTDMSRFARRRPVSHYDGQTAKLAWEERTLSIPELIDTVAPGRDARSDVWLFRRLTRVLDRRMLSILSDPKELNGAGPFSLTLNVASVLGAEFLRFDAALPAALRSRIAISFLPADIASDAGAFAFARNFARGRSYRVCMRAVSATLLPALDLVALDLDFIQMIWSPEFSELTTLPNSGRAKWIVGQPCTPEAIAWGVERGITLFSMKATD